MMIRGADGVRVRILNEPAATVRGLPDVIVEIRTAVSRFDFDLFRLSGRPNRGLQFDS